MRPRSLACSLSLALAALLLPASAGAAKLGKITSFKTSVNVSLDLTITTSFDGRDPADLCPAPYETWQSVYRVEFDTRRSGLRGKPRFGATSLRPDFFGTSTTIGVRGAATERSQSAPWELTLRNESPDCGPVSPPPPWASSPTCSRISGAIQATLVPRESSGDDDEVTPLTRDGRLIVLRTSGGAIRPSCLRMFGSFEFPDEADGTAGLALGPKTTLVSVPVKGLRGKLLGLTRGRASARPSFSISNRISGPCNDMTLSHGIGGGDGLVSLNPQPLQGLGHHVSGYTCKVDGELRAAVRREGKAATIDLDKLAKTPRMPRLPR